MAPHSIFHRIKESRRLTQIIILTSFLFSFLIIRVITNFQRSGFLPVQTGTFHIHHLVPGIILVTVGGYIGLSFWDNKLIRLIASVFFGIGAALTIDEFALWLFLKDVYWLKEGRHSIDAIIIATTLITISFVLSEIHDHSFIKRLLRK